MASVEQSGTERVERTTVALAPLAKMLGSRHELDILLQTKCDLGKRTAPQRSLRCMACITV
jgi:hypothetical protein